MQSIVLEAVQNLKTGLNIESSLTVVPEVASSDVHPAMSPRVSGEQIKAGFYDKLNGLQGVKDIWYVGNYIAGFKTPEIMKHINEDVLPGLMAGLKTR